jgi:two-component system phosphate regulon sensor histidine kinase PhoR
VKGFGLGLAYTKKIFELHEGTIELVSEKGNGTTFIITLPHA